MKHRKRRDKKRLDNKVAVRGRVQAVHGDAGKAELLGQQVVSAAASAELSGQRPDFLFKARFHPSVDVLRPSACRPIRMRPNGAPHSLEASEELSHFAGLENADSAELSHKRRVRSEV